MLIRELLALFVSFSTHRPSAENTSPVPCLPLSAKQPCTTCCLPSAPLPTPAWQKHRLSGCECQIVGGPPSPHPGCSSALCFYQACLSWGLGFVPHPRGSPETPMQAAAALGRGGIAACPRLVILTSESSAHGSEQLAYLTLSLPWWLGC